MYRGSEERSECARVEVIGRRGSDCAAAAAAAASSLKWRAAAADRSQSGDDKGQSDFVNRAILASTICEALTTEVPGAL